MPAKISTSDTRSGRSLMISPRFDAFPAATATMPSNMFSQSRSSAKATPTTRYFGCCVE